MADDELKARREAERIVDLLDDHLNAGRFAQCDDFFRDTDPATLTDTGIVSALGITIAAKPKLTERQAFYARAVAAVVNRHGPERAAKILSRYE